jgi:hypothetical protein
MFPHGIHDEKGSRQPGHIGDRSEVLFEFGTKAFNLQPFFLGKRIKCTVFFHPVYGGHFLDGLSDGYEIGKHASRPSLGDIGHVYVRHLVGNNVFCLFLGGYKKYFSP